MPYFVFLAASFVIGLYWRLILGTMPEDERVRLIFNLCLGGRDATRHG